MPIEKNISDFRTLVESEPERSVTHLVSPLSAELKAKAQTKGGLKLTELLSTSRKSHERVLRYRHILGTGASDEATRPWNALPADLLQLVRDINGIHLWANIESGRAYMGLAPIEEWMLAREKMYGAESDRTRLDDRYVVISYHADNASFVVVDAQTGSYFLMDTAGPDTSTKIADSVGDLLQWLWRRRIPPSPSPV